MQKPAPPSNKKRCSCVCAISRHEFYIRYQYSQPTTRFFSSTPHLVCGVSLILHHIMYLYTACVHCVERCLCLYFEASFLFGFFFAARKKFIYEIINPRAGKKRLCLRRFLSLRTDARRPLYPTQTPATLFPSWCWYFIPARASKTLFANKMSSRNVNN